jgi:cellulose synthase/poly-beta-1,6-N-acetylglucosamine synthase-like glycosyltransferase
MITVSQVLFYATAYVTLFVSLFWFSIYLFNDKKDCRTGKIRPLTMLVPAYNEEKSLARCLNSVLAQKYPKLRIIIVDDGSTDRTGAVAKSIASRHRNVKYLRKKHSGKAASLNEGLRHVHTKLFAFIDSDTYLSGGALRNMVRYIDGNTASVIASIRPHNPRSTIEKLQQVEYIISSFTRKLMSLLNALYYTPGFAIYRTSVIKKLGGFDEQNLTEDLEIGLRLKNHGYDIANSLEDKAYTNVPQSFGGLFRQRIRWYRGNIYNSRKYSHIFFNRKFGDLGLMVLPLQYLLLTLIIPFFIIGIYENAVFLGQRFIDLYLVGFDLKYLASTTHFNVITPTTFFFAVTIAAFAIMIWLSEKKVKDSISKLDYVVYIIIYPFINLVLWLSALLYELARAKKKW